MTSPIKIVDEQSTVALISAFKRAVDEVNTAHSSVSASQLSLAGGWKGAAAQQFDSGLGEWIAGLKKIGLALDKLDEGMVSFSQLTADTEDNAVASAAAGTVASWT
ncbi:WXG100 family type VII secretion target [Paractinoplanes atraurantiacus]|uniref:WXG100 family type VII secretion target n=1 Tax=Paractinoplanes atraurantiacus TaxID=1036182 RepID=A0A285KD17_9ACTN|nr:WXG100 family type VII secretion target [Actinoplanes atraurantiacus]SNY69827.1 WXG100 family type VII secretion target [Actinoplanes atraurantiacus]